MSYSIIIAYCFSLYFLITDCVWKARWLLNNKLLLFFFQWLGYHLSFFYFLLIIYVFFLYIFRQLVELFKFYVKKWSLIIWEAHAISWSVLKKYFQSRAPRLLLSIYILCIYDLIRLYASERFVNFNPVVPDVRKMVKHVKNLPAFAFAARSLTCDHFVDTRHYRFKKLWVVVIITWLRLQFLRNWTGDFWKSPSLSHVFSG